MTTIWTFLKSPIGRWICVAILVAGMLFAVRAEGYRAGKGAEQAAQAKRFDLASKAAQKVADASAKISSKALADLQAANARNAALTLQLQQKVPTYVTPQADRRCIVSRGYVELRNAAGAGVDPVPPAAGGSVDTDSGLVLSDLAQNDILNAAAFHTAVDEVKAWRGWYVAQADLWSKTIKAPDPTP